MAQNLEVNFTLKIRQKGDINTTLQITWNTQMRAVEIYIRVTQVECFQNKLKNRETKIKNPTSIETLFSLITHYHIRTFYDFKVAGMVNLKLVFTD